MAFAAASIPLFIHRTQATFTELCLETDRNNDGNFRLVNSCFAPSRAASERDNPTSDIGMHQFGCFASCQRPTAVHRAYKSVLIVNSEKQKRAGNVAFLRKIFSLIEQASCTSHVHTQAHEHTKAHKHTHAVAQPTLLTFYVANGAVHESCSMYHHAEMGN